MEEDKGTRRPKESKKYLGYIIAGMTAAAVSVAIYAGTQYLYQKFTGNGGATFDSASAQTPEDLKVMKSTSASFRAVAKKVSPAVVTIKATRERKKPKRSRRQYNPFDDGQGENGREHFDPFHEFFERFGQPMPQPESPAESMGSGFIVDSKGFVVTNNHVVKGATKVLILPTGDGGEELKAKVVGTDPRTDLAVLKIQSSKTFPVIEWADSDTVEVGDWAIAMGSPFSLDQSMTVGIVSAKARESQAIAANQYGTLIQTDAAINPGNSGGPLCTIEGRVMGVNQAIYTRSGGYMGIGFAIPANLAKVVVGKLMADGKVVRGWLGVYIQPVKKELLKELGVKHGIAVQRVMEDSPAAKAGIKAGDVITEVEGVKMKKVNQLQLTIADYPPGKTVKMEIVSYASKKERTVKVKLGTLPDETPQGQEEEEVEPEGEPDKMGLLVTKHKDGVKVGAVANGSVAYGFIKKGDVIVRLNRKKLTSVAQYKKLLSKSRNVSLLVLRKGQTLFFQFTLPD